MDKIPIYFKDFSEKTEYSFLEEGSVMYDEMLEVAKKRGLRVPCEDIALFKGIFAYTDEKNLNGCIMPHQEVVKSLDTIFGKAIDKDHLRKNALGFWLDAKLDGNIINAYGAFWKNNFKEEYADIKKRMSEGKLKISMEAWGHRVYNKDNSYFFTDIEFAGGALLFDTKPAFPNAEVLEMSFVDILKNKENINFNDNSKKNGIKEGEIAKMDELEKKIAELSAKIGVHESTLISKDKEIASLKEQVEKLTKEIEDAKIKLETEKVNTAKAVEEANVAKAEIAKRINAEKASLVEARRKELTEEFAKNYKDEDLLDELKFELAKSKKELADLKSGKKSQEKASIDAGAKSKEQENEIFAAQDRVRKQAYPDNKQSEE